jgi:TPP-dependent pyruvate/acetoin dehydrogenase alpha subunit
MAFADKLTQADLLQMYRWMTLTRAFEDRVCELWGTEGVVELPHGSQGQEAIAVGACFGLRPTDLVMPSLRARGVFLARGVAPRVQMAAAYAKASGAARGKSSGHHMGDRNAGILLGSAIVGASITVAVGAALALKLQGRDDVVVCFFGDGAAQRGDFHEGLNFAGVFKLPIIFVLENNGYAEYTPVARHSATADFASRAKGYGFEGLSLDGNDVLAVYAKTQQATAKARSGGGPTLLECVTYRFRSHNEVTPPETCRDPAEIERWKPMDPLLRIQTLLRDRGFLSPADEDAVQAEIRAQIEDAVQFAEQSTFPSPEELLAHVYAAESSEFIVRGEL